MRIDVVTLFPEMVEHAARFGVTGRARERGLWRLAVWNPRDFATDSVPDRRRPAVRRRAGDGDAGRSRSRRRSRAARAAQASGGRGDVADDLPVAGGQAADARAGRRAGGAGATTGYVLVAGRYEGIDERLVAREVDEEIAIGDFVVSGGELPALMLIDAIVRLLPGALNDARIGAAGFVRRRAARLPALHAAGGVRRASGARTCCCRGITRRSGAGGSQAVAAADVAAAARPARGPGAVEGRAELLAEYRRAAAGRAKSSEATETQQQRRRDDIGRQQARASGDALRCTQVNDPR